MTAYVIEGPQEDLKKIYDAIKNPSIQDDSSPEWEGNVLNTLGIEWVQEEHHLNDNGEFENNGGYYVRGFIFEDPQLDETLSFSAEEAWGLTDFRILLKKHFPDIKVYWVVEEAGSDVFATNDTEGKYFPERYYVDIWTDETDGIEYFSDNESALKYVSNMTKGAVNSIEDIDKFNDEHSGEDQYIIFRKYEVIKEE